MAKGKLKYRFTGNRSSTRVSFQAFGKNHNEIFSNSATALMDCMVDLSTVNSKFSKTIKLQSKNINLLLASFLNELCYYKGSENMLLNKFDVKVEEDKKSKVYRVTVKIIGEPVNQKQHLLRCDVKTAHLTKIEKKGKTYEAKVILGI